MNTVRRLLTALTGLQCFVTTVYCACGAARCGPHIWAWTWRQAERRALAAECEVVGVLDSEIRG